MNHGRGSGPHGKYTKRQSSYATDAYYILEVLHDHYRKMDLRIYIIQVAMNMDKESLLLRDLL